ncbi:MAG TPA: DNA internalization-related competence protein ComEC/Rec2 [Candidatus Hydrogenedentes bacterium]|nr:DNA internalization-related competence protein ComEC/Rec2 [Candidatus Hydrogenedentota bacterium]HIJ72814.1 DNA internalization-related competence protein ComEC/Rec2 [Candidatus Hydrogenedentota bacterium]
MKRPVVWVAAALAAGIWAAATGLVPGAAAPISLCFAALVVLFVRRHRSASQRVGLALSFFAAGALLWNGRHAGPPGDALSRYSAGHPDAAFVLEGRVRRPDLLLAGASYTRFVLDVDLVRVDGKSFPLRGSVFVRWTDPSGPVFSDERVRVAGTLDPALGRVNPGVESIEDYLRRRGVHTAIRLRGPEAVDRVAPGRRWSASHWVSRLRRIEADRLRRCVPETVLEFVLCVWLGDRTEMTSEEYARYVVSGTAHILSVSGVHAGIIYVSGRMLLGFVLRNRRLRAVVTMLFVFVFALVAGARVATLRAAIMIALYLMADLFEREPDAPTALSLSGILFLLHTPDILFDPGAQLSFASIGSILVFREAISVFLERLPRLLRDGLATTLAVQILPFPLAIHRFHILPLAAPLANLAVVPLLTVTLWLCLLTTACSLVVPPAAPLFGHALVPVVYSIRGVVAFVAHVRGSHLYLVSPTVLAMLCYWATVAFGYRALAALRPKPWAIGAALVLAATWICWRPFSPRPEVVFLDVGHGDAAFIRSPEGTTVLIDGGDSIEYIEAGRRVVAPFLWASHVSHLDYVVMTHPDRDHGGGLAYVIDHFTVGRVILNPLATDQRVEEEILARCAERRIPVQRMAKGDTIPIAGGTLEVLHPPSTWPPTSPNNDASLVLRLDWPGMDVLFTGDIEVEAETAVVSTDCRATVLKAPHHGSRTSSSQRFIDCVMPRHCVVSTGGYGGRQAVSDAVIDRYEHRGVAVWRTDRLGAISLRQRDGNLDIYGERQRRGYVYEPRL